MKATDRQLIDISEELTAYIMKPTFNLCLSPDECIILNKLITEEFERRQKQDVMGSSDRQDPSLGQTGADNNDGNINASECRDSEVSGVEVRKEKTQITKVSKKEYLDNRDKHGTYIETYFETCDMTDQPESHFGKEPYEEPEVPYKKIAEKGSEVTEAVDKLITGTRGDELAEKRKADDDDSIPIAWLKSEIEETRKFLKTETDEKVMHDEIAYIVNINSIINCWGRYGKDDWKEKEENTNETTEEKIWKIPPILQAIIKDVHFVLCTETTEEYKDIFEVGKIYPTRGNNNGIHVIGIAGHGDPYDLLCHTWGDENGCEHHPAELGDELPPTFIPLESLDLGTFQFPIDT